MNVKTKTNNVQGNGSEDRPPKPKALKVRPENIPAALKAVPQWVVWKYVWKTDKEKWDKPLFNARTRYRASSTDPKTWVTYDEAYAAYQRGGWDGIGIVLTETTGVVGIDLDKCRDRKTGVVED